MMNKIWAFFLVVGITTFLFTGRVEQLNKEILDSSSKAIELLFQLFPIIALWLGIMNIAVASGLLDKMAHKLSFILKRLFPEIPKGHPSLKYISSNIIANMLGLGSAATPFGLKAMEELQKINSKKDTASRSMITFLVLNTSGVTIIPTTIISMRMMYHSVNPTEILLPCLLATGMATLGGLIIDRIVAKKRGKYDHFI